ncbi:hypothetical protein CFE70_000122 [Pyrenophora teres f. teres 0-1]|uniref:Uncharacterized protein n=2 Tax=Pyrenophora teres f. teres TaxID=97479 RepID=E3S717_PYRTT|nr:hypothetical protein PTT_18583 [Pyrenophora teres f. teres 0-1]KAE8836626.1 hypothetical protein HRS9139_04724 [Pyrenophora teres f. teres]KAE8862227.1 hypothetical protein PTNB29_04789 [Pyrenophora teres f. teres]KAE8869530.1 hypothetical protein PTNB73_04583 [Pyrenophora teres f. teres]CAE6995591.1 hypothetical protein PTTW11_00139 [Pyrenophora teres f. teres]
MASSSPTIPLPPNRTCDITVDLYCPYHRKMVQDFIITACMTHNQILESIEAALVLNRFKDGQGRKIDQEIFVCDINGHRIYDSDSTNFNFNNIVNDEELLIGTKHNSRVRPSPKLEAVLYLEDDTRLLEKSVQDSDREALRGHISDLIRKDASIRKNVIRLVKPHTFITANIEALDNALDGQENTSYSITHSKAIMASNWYWDGTTQQFSQKVFALMAILSEATPGHPEIPMDIVINFKNERILDPLESPDIQEKDVKNVIRRLYRIAPSGIGSVWPGASIQKKIERNDIKKARGKERKGKEKRVEAPDEKVEELSSRR